MLTYKIKSKLRKFSAALNFLLQPIHIEKGKRKMSMKKQTYSNRQEKSSQRTLVEGSTWMSLGSVVSKLLGALYIIPWMAWMGNQETANAANALFHIGYDPYGLFLALATAGIPSAISQQISYYNAIKEYEISKSIYKRAIQLMAVTGIIAGGLMFIFAPNLSAQSPNASISQGVVVIRSLVPALFVIPMMSVTRGFLQGHNTMAPSAVSQIIEQFTRIIFMLGSVYIIRQVMGGSVLTAVSLSTFAAFVGALFSFLYLLVQLRKKDTALNRSPEESMGRISISTNQLIKDIIQTAMPFIIISVGISLAQLMDQFTYAPIMENSSGLSAMDIQITYGVSHANANKLIMILISFGASIATASIPLLSQLTAEKDYGSLKKQISNIIQLLMLIILPAVGGMAVLAGPLYTLFYNYSEFGTTVTQVSTLVALVWALFTVLSNVLKAINVVRPILVTLLAGLLLKLALQYPFVSQFGVYGMLITTIISFALIALIYLILIQKHTHLDLNLLVKRTLLIILATAVMCLVVGLSAWGLGQVFPVERKMNAFIVLIISITTGVVTYAYLVLKMRLAEKIISAEFSSIRQKLRIK